MKLLSGSSPTLAKAFRRPWQTRSTIETAPASTFSPPATRSGPPESPWHVPGRPPLVAQTYVARSSTPLEMVHC
jgi:hypothetical protein